MTKTILRKSTNSVEFLKKIPQGYFRVSTYLILHEKSAAGVGMSNASIVFLRYNAFRLKLSGHNRRILEEFKHGVHNKELKKYMTFI
jgi:hypothetical protein